MTRLELLSGGPAASKKRKGGDTTLFDEKIAFCYDWTASFASLSQSQLS